MPIIPTPHARFKTFQSKIGLSEQDLVVLDPYRQMFASRNHDFGSYFYDTLHAFPDTRRFLELERSRGQLRLNWTNFFAKLFESRFNDNFLSFLWQSGLTHVEMSVDQRFINLGYILARRFCAQIIEESVPEPDRPAVTQTITKMLDMCLLIATDAFLAATTQCDSEVMNGIAHQVRNPITVIGGFLGSLRRKIGPDSPLNEVYEAMFNETKRLERMVADVGEFITLFRQIPSPASVTVAEVVQAVWRELSPPETVALSLQLGSNGQTVSCDPEHLRILFRRLLENALEAVDPDDPRIAVESTIQDDSPNFLNITITNTGPAPKPEDLEKLFTPFYSAKPLGTGFGLPTARLVARKAQGNVVFTPLAERGAQVLIKLPLG